MTSKTRIFASVLCLLIAIVCILGLASCGKCAHKWGEWTVKSAASCTEDGVEERACTLCGESETRALAAVGHKGGTATCTAPAVCLECDAEYAEALGHDWLTLPGGSLEATCTTDGFSTYKCSRCSESKTETFAASGHSYGVTVVAPTCTESGGTVHTCSACGDSYTDEPTPASGHSWSDTSDCISGRSCSACGESEGGSGHSYEKTVTAPTCSNGGYTTNTCSACGDSYVDSETPARGHVNTDGKTTERKLEGETCKFEVIYECDACGETAVENTVYHHTYKAVITTSATCTTDGVKTLTCSSCPDSYTEPIEKNENGHVWQTKSTLGVKRVDECTVCFATKSVTVVEGNVTPSTSASDLKDTEIEMSDASLSLGDGVIDKVAGKDVVISADKLTGTDRPTEWLDEDQLEQIGDSPVFNFTMSDGEGLVEKFGEGNWVTITVPYDETMGDVDNIAIWFIATDGTLETIPATYNNGYVTFKTDHFSYYTVTRLTPKERCTLYGHNYVSSVVEPTCTEGGYTFTVCIRCTDSFKSKETSALGHSYVTETTEPTCTESGISTSVCSLCQHTSFTILPAKGHDWTLVNKTEASCVAPGVEEYACSGCDLTNKRTYPQLPHTLVKSTVAPTCTEVGYDLFDCSGCDYYYTNNETPAIGHDLAPSFSWADDFSAATLNLICKHDEAHVFTVEAEITNRNVDDAELAKIEHTARAVYNGETYTDVKTEVLGDHTHDYSYKVGFDADYHWLECICGDKKNVTEHEWTDGDILIAPTCFDAGVRETVCQCGAKGASTVPATGEHDYVDGICSVCGSEKKSDFYINLVSAAKKYDSLSFEIEELFYYQTRKGTLDASLTMLDGIRIEISEKDGELCLAGSGSISIYNGPIEGETVTNSFDLLIEDETIYASTKIYTASRTVDEQWIVMPLEVMGNEIGEDLDDVPTAVITIVEMLPSILGELSRVTDAITAEHTEAVNGILESTFNIFFTTEATDDGYTVTLDAEKIDAFLNNLKDMKITELVDHYYGEGAAEAIKSAALELGALKLSELGEYLAGLGVSEELFYEVADSICAMIGAPDAFSLKDMVEEYKDLTVAELGEDNPLTAESIDALFKMLSEHSLSELWGIDPTNISVDTVVMTLLESFRLSLDTDKDGSLLGVRVSLAEINESFAPGVDVNLAFSSYFKMGDEAKLDMSALKTDALSKIVDAPDNMKDKLDCTSDYYNENTFVCDGVEYGVEHGSVITLTCINSTTPISAIISNDCGNWNRHETLLNAKTAKFLIVIIKDMNDGDIVGNLVVNDATGEIVWYSFDSNSIILVYPDDRIVSFPASEIKDTPDLILKAFPMDDDDWTGSRYVSNYFYHNSVSNEYAGNSQHEYETTFELEGTDCTEGCIRTTACKKCGDSDNYKYNSHASNDGPSDSIYLDSFGICSGEISYKECIACDAYYYVNADFYACNFSYSIQGDWTVHTCRDCGVIYSRKVVNGAKDEDCHRTIYVYYSIVKDGVTVFEGYTSEYREMHDYDYSYELLGESCYDGVIETAVCRDCGYAYENDYEYHRIIYTDPLEGVSCCIDHDADIGKCACGKEHRYSFSYDLVHEVTEDGEIYFCDACGVRIIISLEVSEKDCVRTEKRDIITTLSGKTVFTGSITFEYKHHDIAIKAQKTEGGAVITEYCRDCGASTELNYVTVELEKHGSEYYYDLYFTPERDGEYTLISVGDRDTKATLYKLVGNSLNKLDFDDDNGPGSNFCIAYELSAGETYVYRISFYSRENSGSIAYAMLDSAWEYECDHSAESICDGVLFEGAADCMGGAVYYVVCPSCMEPIVLNVVSDHEPVFEHDDIDLTDSGCDGYIERESCVCGKNDRHEIFNLCYDNYTENEYFDEDGNLVFVRTFSCSECTRRYEISSYFEYDRAACATVTYYTVVISNNSGYSNKLTYSEVDATHDYEYDFIFDGNSKDCYDGVTVNMTCTVCGNKDSEHVEYHVEYLKERIDLKSIGSVCGGYADIYSCPCGSETSVDLEHSLCDSDHRYIDPWTSDYVSGYHYHTEGYDYYSNDFEEYRCSVTDPAERACTFTIRTAHYWHRDPKTCSATFRTEILIGYDPATGRAAYTYTHDSDSVQQVHDYEGRYYDIDLDGRNGYRGVCRDCGGHYDYYDYVSGNETVYVDSRTNNAKNGFNKSSYEESRYVYFNGSNQCTYDYYKTVDANGVETWEKSVTELELITAPFGSDAFSRKTSTTYSSGESSYREEEITYYKGFSYRLLYYYVEKVDGSWYREEYSYSFENGCHCTLTYTDSNGKSYTNSYSDHRTTWGVIENPTCTQTGTEGEFCHVCDEIVYSYPVGPTRHSWTYVGDYYVCKYCMLENANGATGDITLEDLSGLLGGDTDYVIGYYAETGVSFVYNVSIILKNGTDEQIILDGISFSEHDTYCAIVFSKAEVKAAAAALGYSADQYDVRFAFVPIGSDGSFDYAITLTEGYPPLPDVVNGVGTYTAWIGETGYAEFTLRFAEGGDYRISSLSHGDTFIEVYRDGELTFENDDDGDGNNFAFYYCAEANTELVIRVRFLSGYEGCFPVVIEAMPW